MCWKVEYIILILITTLITYLAGIQIGKEIEKRKKKWYLVLCVATNLLILFIFKYFNFFNHSFKEVFNFIHIAYNVPALNVLLPVGISFYTFQSLSYTIDVYNGRKEPEKHFGIFAVYVAFFPQLVAGPIERSAKLIPQFYKHVSFEYSRVTDGLRLMAWGFFKKIVIADRLALLVDQVYNHPTDYTGLPLILASYFFAFQIYCDFSGYSDIAIGAARVMGFDLSKNFNFPYFARNISDFWRRWHITLTSWFRDYIYINLGGNRVDWKRWCYNILIVFLLSGLWHGANWTFIIWGSIHGTLILFSRFLQKYVKKLNGFISLSVPEHFKIFLNIIITFHMVTFAWIFFRANSIGDAFYILINVFNMDNTSHAIWQTIHNTKTYLGLNLYELFIACGLILFLISTEFLNNQYNAFKKFLSKPIIVRWAYYYFIVFIILIFGKFSINSFIYFQF
jgi:D-alanyl-lipoteichoic acid acyltransferase DltB (MBOAT superfamily)